MPLSQDVKTEALAHINNSDCSLSYAEEFSFNDENNEAIYAKFASIKEDTGKFKFFQHVTKVECSNALDREAVEDLRNFFNHSFPCPSYAVRSANHVLDYIEYVSNSAIDVNFGHMFEYDKIRLNVVKKFLPSNFQRPKICLLSRRLYCSEDGEAKC